MNDKPKLFRKKPVVIEALQYGPETNGKVLQEFQDDIADFMGTNITTVGDKIEIATLEGVITASFGDWIIKGVHGEFYPCKPDIFAQTYEIAALTPQPTPTMGDALELPEVRALKDALHRISLGSQNSGTTKEDLGREARTALAKLTGGAECE
jgi:hypothetical protein